MYYPSFTRSNHRYRGPMESRKLNKKYTDIYYDLSRLYSFFDAIRNNTTTFMEEMRNGNEQASIIGQNDMSDKLVLIHKKIENMKGGDWRG